ncbi:MAG: hypothetical protein A2580_11810 [Hydrogenophilales bacterium RIFOXYD1_FULL_62_11]|nr:MAG: hypothetical protein A2580_11810 [Hydrogenophilales bacterium RIFOXYD1_FULL_62_11]
MGIDCKSLIPASFLPCNASSPFDLENRPASLIQRDGHPNNALIKSDSVPVEWGKTTALLAQNDINARWTKQGGQQDESGRRGRKRSAT